MKNNSNTAPTFSNIVDFSAVRTGLNIPTLIAAIIASRTGACIKSVSPGIIRAVVPGTDGRGISIRVSRKNIYRDEAEAYRLLGLSVPERVLADADQWDRTFNGRR